MPTAPPDHVIGAMVPGSTAVLARTEDSAVVLRRITAYPQGLLVTIDTFCRPGTEAQFHPWSDPYDPSKVEGNLRVRLLLADGTTVGSSPMSHPENPFHPGDPSAPRFLSRGGAGSGIRLSEDWWLYPLPASDVVAIVVRWLDREVPETVHRLDLGGLPGSGDLVDELWPVSVEPPEHGWFAFAPLSSTAYAAAPATHSHPDLAGSCPTDPGDEGAEALGPSPAGTEPADGT